MQDEEDPIDSEEDIADLLKGLSSLKDINAGSTSASEMLNQAAVADIADLNAFPVKWGDDFVLLERLDGGMTGAFLAEQTKLAGHRYVIKIPHNTASLTVQRFEQEAAILGRLHRVGVTQVPFPIFFGWHEGLPFFAMEYIDGRNLKQLIESPDWQPSLLRITEIIGDAAMTLAAAHRIGVVHRDIKPSNLMVSANGKLRVIDFGVAKDEQLENPIQTKTGSVPGTQAYMAPEQLAGQTATPRSDIFSLGVVFQELLDRSREYERSDRAEFRRAVSIAAKMTDRSDDKRFRSFEAVAAGLDSFANIAQRGRRVRYARLACALIGFVCLAVANKDSLWPARTQSTSIGKSNAAENTPGPEPIVVNDRETVSPAENVMFNDEPRWMRTNPRRRR